ncbi:hypothetical protein HGP28_06865 [Vibrio sp. SM6]|uniref:6-bladed beta-propeller n=2 Tax=Vibrio agarilyticus TaxID=2726741 RepID=A0A7X8YGE9_9VIBR|nr:hypothetical protein [Vibrio agarilyticus]
MTITFQTYIGDEPNSLPPLPCSSQTQLSLNTPVGNTTDDQGRVWLADTANNRVLVFDPTMTSLLARFGEVGDGPQQFNMPFRLLSHPEKPWIYVSDIANTRVHILEYDAALNIRSIAQFGHESPVSLKGPNGLAFFSGELCVADEFYEGDGGASRLVIFSETGDFLREIHHVVDGDQTHHFLWPQGMSQDNNGHLYIANTGFANIVRCDWHGQGVPFADGSATIEQLELARGVSVINERILIPGGAENAITIYDLDGHYQGAMIGFFSPVQISAKHGSNQLLITEPFLASLQWHELDVTSVRDGQNTTSTLISQVGEGRNQPGQFHFVTATTGNWSREVNTLHQWTRPALHPINNWLEQQTRWQENWLNAVNPIDNSWVSLTMTTQLEWLQRWQSTWLRIVFGGGINQPNELLWIVDSGNFQLQASEHPGAQSAQPASLPLLPGSLGVTLYHPSSPLPGQLDPATPMLIVSNFLTGIVTLFQYDPYIKELIPYTAFGGLGKKAKQFHQPQGLAIDPLSNDILLADSGNNRISRWRITPLGQAKFISTFGHKGEGDGAFFTPTDIAIDALGRRFIADQKNDRIEIYDAQDRWIGRFGQYGYGTKNSNFLLPTSIEYDNGFLFISDLVNRAIKVFTPDGNFVESFSGFGADSRKGQLWMPYLMHVKDGVIYLPDCTLNRINVYQFSPTPTSQTIVSSSDNFA